MPGFGGGIIEMAEKQYKNYDERFLKEDTSSSEPIEIEGYVSTADSSSYVLINQLPELLYLSQKNQKKLVLSFIK